MRVYTGGTFDIFHRGHVNLLRKCKEFGEVWVSLNTDAFIEEYKGKAPTMTYNERRAVLRACKYVDFVIPNLGGKDSRSAIRYVKPGIIAIGSDWTTKDYYKQMGFTQDWLDENDIVLMYVPHVYKLSSTAVKGRVNGKK